MAGKCITCDGRQYGQRTSVNRWSDELKKKINKRQLLRIRHAFVESIAGLPVTAVKKRCCVTDTPIVRFPPMQTGVTDTKTTVWTKKMRVTVSDIQTAFVFVSRPPVLPTHPYSVRPPVLPTHPYSVRPPFLPTRPLLLCPAFQPFLPPSLYFSIHSFDFPLFRPTVCRPVLPTLLPCSRWLPSCSWPSLPSAVRRSVLLYGWFIIRLVGFTYLRYKERKYDSALHGHDLTEPIQCVLRQRRVILKQVHRAP